MSHNKIKLFLVDAFTATPFGGNPAAVCILNEALGYNTLLQIAKEMNLSETAFVLPASEKNHFYIRWFTPKMEMDICGHATMAAAKVLFELDGNCQDKMVFQYGNGSLFVENTRAALYMDFPVDKVAEEVVCSEELLRALGIQSYVKAVVGEKTRKLVIQVENSDQIRAMKPDFNLLHAVKFDTVVKGVGVTAMGTGDYDFISRYFNPWAGVNEDPVTGSVHTLLAAYWSEILNKTDLKAYQASERGGELLLKLLGNERVEIGGKAVIISKGELCL